MNQLLRERLERIQLGGVILGVVALGVTAIGAWTNARQFYYSWLFGLLFWVGLSLGCFLVSMIHFLAGGRWGYPTRRFLEAGFMVLPLMIILFIPVFIGVHQLYPWANATDVAADPVLRQRMVYQNPWAFIGRAVFFLGIWSWMMFALRKFSLQQDRTTDATPTRKARNLSGIGVVISGLLATFAYIDWIMSLEKHWYSTMFPVIIMGGQILVAYAFATLMMSFFRRTDVLQPVVTKTHYHHLGNLLLTFVLFWTYVSFGQLLIIYSGNIPHEVDWYLHRIANHWKLVVGALGLFHFFLPFFLLLFRVIKCHYLPLTIMAGLLFVIHIVEVYWLIMPSFHQDGLQISWMDFTAPLGVGGLWVAAMLWRVQAAPLLPQNDPGMQFAFSYVESK